MRWTKTKGTSKSQTAYRCGRFEIQTWQMALVDAGVENYRPEYKWVLFADNTDGRDAVETFLHLKEAKAYAEKIA